MIPLIFVIGHHKQFIQCNLVIGIGQPFVKLVVVRNGREKNMTHNPSERQHNRDQKKRVAEQDVQLNNDILRQVHCGPAPHGKDLQAEPHSHRDFDDLANKLT